MSSHHSLGFVRALARRRLVVLLSLVALIGAASASRPWRTAMAQVPPTVTETPPTRKNDVTAEAVPGEILVRFRPRADAATKAARLTLEVRAEERTLDVQVESLGGGEEMIAGLRLARVPAGETAAAIEALKARPDVLYAEPNYVRRKAVAPNDARYAEQWGLRNTGQVVAGQNGGVAGTDVKAEQAWDITRGSRSVVVGVVDEGVDINHPDLRDNVWTNPGDDADRGFPGDAHGWDFVHNDGSVYDGSGSYPADRTDEHGTHVAGIIGASGDNGVGVAGVNWQVSLLPIKVLGPDGGNDADIIRGLAYAKMLRDLWVSSGGARGANVRVLNNSYGGRGFSQSMLDAVRALNDSGILFVAAAGNNHSNDDYVTYYPAAYDAPNVIAVAATTQYDQLAFYSNFGGHTVALAAPGSYVLSTTPGNTYSFFSGTSMAAPHVAGAAALLCAARPEITVAQQRNALVLTGDHYSSLLTNETFSGRRLNIFAALQSVAESDSTPPSQAANLSVQGEGRAKTLRWTAPGDDGDAGRAALYEISFVDGATGTVFPLATQIPSVAGAQETAGVNIPYRHAAGTLVVKTFDNAGNTSAASVAASGDQADPYTVTEGDAGGVSIGGTPMNLRADDDYRGQALPFGFAVFGRIYTTVSVSTNGALYFSQTPRDADGVPDDYPSSASALNATPMIAGLWDDLRTDRRASDDVYVSQPTPDSIVFRWQAVTHDVLLPSGARRGENPVNFEIELRRDGTVITRYGAGNANVLPVVGVSGGEPEAYVSASHTAELFLSPAPVSLANAPSVTFKPNIVSITGHVANTNGAIVQVRLTGSRTFTNNTDSNGNFAFYGLPTHGNFTVMPSRSDSAYRYEFTPPSQTFNNLSADQVANFTMRIVTYSVRGRVIDDAGVGLPGVTLTSQPFGGGQTVQTDANGNYVFNLPAGQSFLISPLIQGYNFTPQRQTVSGLEGDVTLTDFIAHRLYSVTGRVTDASGRGMSGVTVNLTGNGFQSADTDANGNYSFPNLTSADYTFTPYRLGYSFQPDSQTITGLNSNRTLPDFVVRPLYEIQGYVRDAAGSGISGVLVSLSGGQTTRTMTAADGSYHLGAFPAGGTYTVTVSKSFYTFDVPSVTYTNLSGAQSPAFVGTRAQNTILGRVTDAAGQPVSNISIALTGEHGYATQTDGAGYYVVGDLLTGASYTLTPTSQAYDLAPASRTFDNYSGTQLAADFAATARTNMRIDGVIDDGNGHGVWGVRVRISDNTNQAIAPSTVLTDAAGRFSFTNLTGGHEYSVVPQGDAFNGFSPFFGIANMSQNATMHFTATGLVAQPKSFQFAQTDVRAGEYTGSVQFLVLRAGDTSTVASVDYATSDDQAAASCDDTVNNHGSANARCDYAAVAGTLTFAPGQSQRLISVPLVDDAYVESDEHLTLRLSNPSGAPLGAQATATLTILDDDVPWKPNPTIYPDFFIRQQYLDFLDREPDVPGLQFYLNILNGCGASDDACLRYTRGALSANFFRSPEFQQKGSFVMYLYMVTLGQRPATVAELSDATKVERPHFSEFMTDLQAISDPADDKAVVSAKKDALTVAWLQRAEIAQRLPATLSNSQFVQKLSGTSGVSPASQSQWVSALDSGTMTRAQVLRAFAESPEVDNKFYKQAFVTMEYFGYLRRDPEVCRGSSDPANCGYIFHNARFQLSADPDFLENTIVRGFIESPEYRSRFGPQ